MICPKCRKDRVIYTKTEIPFIKKRICTKCGYEEFELKEFIIKEEE